MPQSVPKGGALTVRCGRYIPERQLPDKSISLLDTACARVAVSHHAMPAEVENCQRGIEALTTELEIVGREAAVGLENAERRAKVSTDLARHKQELQILQVFDKGVMEYSEGRRVDFRNTLIILTSNVGTELIGGLCKDPQRLPAAQDVAEALRMPPVQHILREAGRSLRLNGLRMEILLALVERAGKTVGKNELLARVWPDGGAEESTLRVHIAALRKILDDGGSGSRYVQTVAVRGYRFADCVTRVQQVPLSTAAHASVSHVSASKVPVAGDADSIAYRANNLPAPLTQMVGRRQVLDTLAARAPQRRFVTLTGPGGIGKTTLALGVAETLAPTRRGIRGSGQSCGQVAHCC